ncbi:hypothetical protein GCM10010218_20050 [Streptomyces mashuensis]|uniref:Uncharacterized protein n=1 Tax=Streptomyces mashuensis TaxID=33904 RepID=A0A919B0X6_9ACTN|nr:hypothetical protein GCM10010218_20050 [Streptomyces mashuensis]
MGLEVMERVAVVMTGEKSQAFRKPKNRQKPKLLTAIERGAEIRERNTYLRALHRPRTAGDPYPWAVYSEGLKEEFHISGRDCMAVWPDGTRTTANGERIETRGR